MISEKLSLLTEVKAAVSFSGHKIDCQDIKKMLEKLDPKIIHEVSTQESSTKSVNLCGQDIVEEMEMTINYTYKDSG